MLTETILYKEKQRLGCDAQEREVCECELWYAEGCQIAKCSISELDQPLSSFSAVISLSLKC